MRLLLIDTRPAPAHWPPDLDHISDCEAADLGLAYVAMSERLLLLVRKVWGEPSRN